MNYQQILNGIGFDSKEVDVYLFLLRHGPSSQQEIADKTGILRQTVYDIMKKMEIKGFVSVSKISKRKHYLAISPKSLGIHLREKEEKLNQIIPDLEKMQSSGSFTIGAESFIGLDGMKNLVNLTLQSKTEILWLSNKEIHDKVFQRYFWHNYAKKRIERKIPIRLLIEPTKETDWITSKKDWRKVKHHEFVSDLNTSYIIFDGNVIIYSVSKDNLFGVFIKNEAIQEMFKKWFSSLWEKSKG